MGRGTHEATKIKRQIKLTAKTAAAIKKAERDMERKDLEKDFPVWLRDRIGKMFEKVDPLELVSVIALTPLVKGAVESYAAFAVNTPWWAYLFGPLGILYTNLNVDPETQKIIGEEQWQIWLVSFGLTYVIVHNFGALLEGGKSILNIASALLAA